MIFASNHVGVIDGPMLAVYAPRPVHALTKHGDVQGLMGFFLRGPARSRSTGSTPTRRAVKSCLRALRDGRAVKPHIEPLSAFTTQYDPPDAGFGVERADATSEPAIMTNARLVPQMASRFRAVCFMLLLAVL